MGYSDNDAMVRVDFFKPSGKWYCTEAIEWTGGYYDVDIIEAFATSLRRELMGRLESFDAVCFKPYHESNHPIQIKAGGWR